MNLLFSFSLYCVDNDKLHILKIVRTRAHRDTRYTIETTNIAVVILLSTSFGHWQTLRRAIFMNVYQLTKSQAPGLQRVLMCKSNYILRDAAFWNEIDTIPWSMVTLLACPGLLHVFMVEKDR